MSSELDELLALLDKYKDIPGNEIEYFIKDLNIVSSKKTTHTYIIYWVYLKWKVNVGKEPIPRNVFFKQFKKYFKQASRDRVRRYYVQSNNFMLHPDEVEAAREECKKERIWQGNRKGGRKSAPERNKRGFWRLAKEQRQKNLQKRRSGI